MPVRLNKRQIIKLAENISEKYCVPEEKTLSLEEIKDSLIPDFEAVKEITARLIHARQLIAHSDIEGN